MDSNYTVVNCQDNISGNNRWCIVCHIPFRYEVLVMVVIGTSKEV